MKWLFIIIDVGLLGMCLLLFLRYKVLSKALIRMERDIKFCNGDTLRQLAISRWMYPKKEDSSLTRLYYRAIENGKDEGRLTFVEVGGLVIILLFFLINLFLVLL